MPTNDLHEIDRKMAKLAESMKNIEKASIEASKALRAFVEMYGAAHIAELKAAQPDISEEGELK